MTHTTSMNAKGSALKSKTHPTADIAARYRKNMGDKEFPVVADKMIESVKMRRERRSNDMSKGKALSAKC